MASNQVEEIKSKLDIVSIIGEKVNLTKSGKNYKGLCPFHGEKTPSFFVSPDIQFFKCYGCSEAGDIFSFVQKFDQLTFREALELLAKRAGVVLEKTSPTDTKQDEKRQQILSILATAAEFYSYLLNHHDVGKKALQYLKQRQIHNQSISDFKLGYAPNSWQTLINYLHQKKNFTLEDIEAAGLIIKSDAGRYYDRFRGRLIFPLTNMHGIIVGFSGRVIEGNEKEAKYLNTPETEVYHKSELLFGLSLAKKAIKDKNRMILVEGEFDVISSHQIGLKEVVAVKGSAVTEKHAKLIRRLTKTLIISLDADSAGQNAIRRAIDIMEPQGISVRVATFAGGKDPDELAKSDPETLKTALNNHLSAYAFFLNSTIKNHDINSLEGKKVVTFELMPLFAKIDNAVEREFYLNKLSEVLNTSKHALEEELAKSIKFASTSRESIENKPETMSPKISRREKLERLIIGLSYHSKNKVEKITSLSLDWFSEPHLKRLLDSLKPVITNPRPLSQIPPELQDLANEVLTSDAGWLEMSESDLTREFQKACLELEVDYHKQALNQISKSMSTNSVEQNSVELQNEYRSHQDRLEALRQSQSVGS